jgi:hypothetical protein
MSEEQKASDQYLELYKLAVEMADRTSARRTTFTTFPFTANTALFAVLFSDKVRGTGAFWIIAAVGLVISVTWWMILKSYRELNSAKFKVIIEMEKNLEAQIFSEEWNHLKERAPLGSFREYFYGYFQYGTVERVAPPVFALLYIAVLFTTLW